jgi:hypothetical protein
MTLLGTGRLTWNRGERVTDRYGAVYLLASGDSMTEATHIAPITLSPELVGKRGQLIAEVIETRESTHLGDWFHGFAPSTPDVGEKIVLGVGTLFKENEHDDTGQRWIMVGLKPDDGREEFWLNPKKLYRAHEQTVKLWFKESKAH